MIVNKFIQSFVFILLTIVTALFSAETEHIVHQVKIYDANWTNPTDGSFPVLTDWKMKIVLEDQLEFLTTLNENYRNIDAYSLVKAGDKIIVTKETFMYETPEQSWFHMVNLTNGYEIDVQGKAFQSKPDIDSYQAEEIFIIRDLFMKKIGDKWTLCFYVKNIHTTIDISSDKYHDYYEGLPLVFLGQEEQELVENNKLRLHLNFFHPILNQPITLVSDLMGGPIELKIIKSETSLQNFEEGYRLDRGGPARRPKWLTHWQTHLVLEDGQELVLNGIDVDHNYLYVGRWGGHYVPEGADATQLYMVGHTIRITMETESNDVSNRKNHIGDFTITNLDNNQSHIMQGKLRYSSFYVPVLP